jgi:hypothetical protein
MIDCYHFKNLISDYIDGNISFNNRKDFEEHLDSCPTCRSLFQSVLSTKNAMRNFAAVSVSQDFMPRLQNKISAYTNTFNQPNSTKGISSPKIPPLTYGFAVAFLIVLVTFFIVNSHQYDEPNTAIPPVVKQQIEETQQNKSSKFPNNNSGQQQRLVTKKEGEALDTSETEPEVNQLEKQGYEQDFQDRIRQVKKQN